jgi:outer membrane protein assembly factor BamB
MDMIWPMDGYNAQNIRRSPYSTGDNPGGERWRFYVNHSLSQYTPVIDGEGTLYLPAHADGLIAVYPKGTLKWVEELDNSIEVFQPALGLDGTIYVGTFYHFYALNPNGTKKWILPVTGRFLCDPIIGLDGTIYVETTTTLYAVDPNGTIKWNCAISPNPAVLSVDHFGNIYFINHSYLYSLSPNGTIRWFFDVGLAIDAPTFSEDGTIYITDSSFTYALDQGGNLIWKVEDSPFGESPSIAPDGTLIATSADSSKIVAIDPSDGHTLWTYDIGSNCNAMSAASIDSDGTIYFAACNQGLYLYAMTSTGTFKWRTSLTCDYIYDAAYIFAAPSIGKDGMVYVTTWFMSEDKFGGYVHAIGGGKIQNIEDGYLHLFGKKVIKTLQKRTIAIGAFTLQMRFFHPEQLQKAEILMDGEILGTFQSPPFEYPLDTRLLGKHTLEAKGYYEDGTTSIEKMEIFFLIL